ncbi:MAG: hypothetical protein LBT26_03790 [Clostridiales Family XIII bacterium]|nr:hypothetical protein [Clostridiales Family XIII bacterium]
MKCYILPIGGTGIRVMRSLVHLCAAGCFNQTPNFSGFKVMCVDSDGANGDKEVLKETLGSYGALQKEAATLLPEIEMGGENGIWSPLPEQTEHMDELIHSGQMSDDVQDVYQFLYTKEERNKKLKGGFYGHTSIGSYFITRELVDDNLAVKFDAAWDNFFGGITADDRIFIIGSMFGGTGASGIPSISRILKQMPLTKNTPIGAALVMPYFRPSDAEERPGGNPLAIDWQTFNTKAQAALSYYMDQGFDSVFRRMYFIGEMQDRFMYVKNAEDGPAQRNKAHVIEAHAAAFLADFFQADDVFRVRFYGLKEVEKIYDKQRINAYISSEMLNTVTENANIFDKLTDFFLFSSLYVKYLYHSIAAGGAACEGDWVKKLEKGDNSKIEEQANKAAYRYCEKFVNWMRELLAETDGKGVTLYAKNNPAVFWLQSAGNYAELYRCSELSNSNANKKGIKRYDAKALEFFQTVVKDEFEGRARRHSGGEIIARLSNVKAKAAATQPMALFMSRVLGLCGKYR